MQSYKYPWPQHCSMPERTYTIHVEVLNCKENETAIAQAAAYLGYADPSVMTAPTFDTVEVQTDGDGPIGVDLTVSLHLSDDSYKRFLDEMTTLRKVISVERQA
jgi:hypothetical protein